MAQSKLAAQLVEATQAARELNSEAAQFGQLKANYASDMAPGGGAQGAGSIAEFLSRGKGGGEGISSGAGGAGQGGSITRYEAPANEGEKGLMKLLGEPIAYIRKLIAAAKWARLPEYAVLRAPKGERDALIAAYEEATKGTSGQGSGGGGKSGGGSGISRTTAYQEQNGTAFTSVATNNQPNASTASAKATVAALGSVVNELKTLNKTVARKDPGMSFRTGEI